jgi:hypothetical protein
VDLFSTIGKVDRAEIQYEPNGRSRGTGVVQFDSGDTAETAICMNLSLLHSARSLILSQPSSLDISMVAALSASLLSST